MISRAKARYLRVSPRKTKNVVDVIRGLSVPKAEAVLDNINKRPALYIKRLISSALDSADKKFSLSPGDLYISLIKVDKGPMIKRYRAMSMGRAGTIRHRTSHVTLELDRIKKPEKKTVAAQPIKRAKRRPLGKIKKNAKARTNRKG